jgi:hypothetical protein
MSAVKRLKLDEPRVAVPILIGLALVLRLPNLRESLWLDEVLYATHIRTPSLPELWQSLLSNPGGPLYRVFSFFWVELVGDHQLLLRAPSLLFGLGSIVATFYVARQFAGGVVPFLAGLFLAFSPAHVWYSQEATPYAMALCLLMTAVAIWWRVIAAPLHRGWLVVYAATLIGACLAHYYAAVFLVPLTWLAWRSPNRRAIVDVHYGVFSAMASMMVLQAIQGTFAQGQGSFLRPFTGLEWWTLFFQWFLDGNTLWTGRVVSAAALVNQPWHLAVQLIALVLVCIGLWRRLSLVVFLLVLPGGMFFLSLVGMKHLYIERYVLFALPFFAIALTRGAVAIRPAAVRGAAIAGVVALSVIAYGGWMVKDDVWTVYKQNPDWRSAADALKHQVPSGDHVRILATIPIDDFLFYVKKAMPAEPLDVVLDPQNRDPLERADPGVQLVLVKNLYWSSGVDGVLARYQQEPRLEFLGSTAVKGVVLYRFRFKG